MGGVTTWVLKLMKKEWEDVLWDAGAAQREDGGGGKEFENRWIIILW